MRRVGAIGDWQYQHHRMVRFEDNRIFAFVAAVDVLGTQWGWVVMLPGRTPGTRTTGEAATALDAARAADAVAAELVANPAAPEDVAGWAKEHLTWYASAEKGETDPTNSWTDR